MQAAACSPAMLASVDMLAMPAVMIGMLVAILAVLENTAMLVSIGKLVTNRHHRRLGDHDEFSHVERGKAG